VTGGVVRGTVRWSSNDACLAAAKQKFHYEYVDIVSAQPMPVNGIDAPLDWACQWPTRAVGAANSSGERPSGSWFGVSPSTFIYHLRGKPSPEIA
jgi:hypothetical protein